MYKFKIKLHYNEEDFFCNKTELPNFKITLPLTKLDMVGSNLLSNSLFFQVIFQLVAFLLLSNVSEFSIGTKTKKF